MEDEAHVAKGLMRTRSLVAYTAVCPLSLWRWVPMRVGFTPFDGARSTACTSLPLGSECGSKLSLACGWSAMARTWLIEVATLRAWRWMNGDDAAYLVWVVEAARSIDPHLPIVLVSWMASFTRCSPCAAGPIDWECTFCPISRSMRVAPVCTWYAWLWAGWHELHLFRLIED